MHAVIAGGYHCKRHGTLYTYEGRWEHVDALVTWTARIFYDKRLGESSGELVVPALADAGAAVRQAIHDYVESVTCAAAARTASSCGRVIGPLQA